MVSLGTDSKVVGRKSVNTGPGSAFTGVKGRGPRFHGPTLIAESSKPKSGNPNLERKNKLFRRSLNKRASVGEDGFGSLSSPVAGSVFIQSKLKSGTYITRQRKPSFQGLRLHQL